MVDSMRWLQHVQRFFALKIVDPGIVYIYPFPDEDPAHDKWKN
jgi:hypothetical protein